jgi:hypothetical protein
VAVAVKYRVGDEIQVTYSGHVTKVRNNGTVQAFKSKTGEHHSVGIVENISVKLLTRAFDPGTLYQDSETGINYLYSGNGFWYMVATQDGGMHAKPEPNLRFNGVLARLVELIPDDED